MSSHNAVSGAADQVVEVAPTSVVADGPVQVAVAQGAAHSTFSLPCSVLLKSGSPVTRCDVRSHPSFRLLMSLYETVDLISWVATVTVLRSDKQFCGWAFHSARHSPDSVETLVGAPMAGYIQSANNGSVTENITLPPDHSFGRRLKGTNLTTAPPVLTFVTANSTALAGIVRMVIVVRVAGVAPIPALVWDEGKPSVASKVESFVDAFADADDYSTPGEPSFSA